MDQILRDTYRGRAHFQFELNGLNELWNWLDMCILILMCTSFVLRLLAIQGVEPGCLAGVPTTADTNQRRSLYRVLRGSSDEWMDGGTEDSSVDDDDWWMHTDALYHACQLLWWAWFVVSISAFISNVRFVNYVAREFPAVGVIMQTLTNVFYDVFAFCGIFGAVVAGFYMFTVGLMPDNSATDGHAPKLSFKLAMWATVGEYFGSTDISAPTHQIVVTWIYTWFTQVLLINLLIAMMNDTYASAKADGDRASKFEIATSTSDAAQSSMFTPPLNIIFFPIRLLGCIPDREAGLYDCQYPEEFVRLSPPLNMLLQMRMLESKPREMRITPEPSEADVKAQQLEILKRVSRLGDEQRENAWRQDQKIERIQRTTAKTEKQLLDLATHLVTQRRPLHVNSRAGNPKGYTPRVDVEDLFTEWDVLFPTYRPKEYTSDEVLRKTKPGEANEEDEYPANIAWNKRESFEGVLRIGTDGYPLNPRGRTGLRGRGDFYLWGANVTVDPIVTRYDPDNSRQLQVLCKWRPEHRQWAIPGTIVHKKESKEDAIKRALKKDVIEPNKGSREGAQLLARLLHSATVIYQVPRLFPHLSPSLCVLGVRDQSASVLVRRLRATLTIRATPTTLGSSRWCSTTTAARSWPR